MRVKMLEDCGAVGIGQIHFVDKAERRNRVLTQKPPQSFRVHLNAVRRTDDEHGLVKHRKHTLHLRREVRVTGRVEQVQRHVGRFKHRLF